MVLARVRRVASHHGFKPRLVDLAAEHEWKSDGMIEELVEFRYGEQLETDGMVFGSAVYLYHEDSEIFKLWDRGYCELSAVLRKELAS